MLVVDTRGQDAEVRVTIEKMSAKKGLQHLTKQNHSRTMGIAGTSDTGTEQHETFLLPRNKQLHSPLHPTVLREVHRHDHRASQDHNRHTSAPLDHTTRSKVHCKHTYYRYNTVHRRQVLLARE